jgi:hypothetical protein
MTFIAIFIKISSFFKALGEKGGKRRKSIGI